MIQFAIAILLAGAVADEGATRLALLDGTTVVGRVSKWDETVVVIDAPDGSHEVQQSQLLDVRFAGQELKPGASPAMSVELVDGTRIAITDFVTDGRSATI